MITALAAPATMTALARRVSDGARFVVTAGHACVEKDPVRYVPNNDVNGSRIAIGICDSAVTTSTLDFAVVTDDGTARLWPEPIAFGSAPRLLDPNDLASLQGKPATFVGAKSHRHDGVIETIAGNELSFDAGGLSTLVGDSGGPLYVANAAGDLTLVGMLIRQPSNGLPIFHYPGPGLARLGLVLAT